MWIYIIPAGIGAIFSVVYYNDHPPVPPSPSGDYKQEKFFKGLIDVCYDSFTATLKCNIIIHLPDIKKLQFLDTTCGLGCGCRNVQRITDCNTTISLSIWIY